MFIFHLSLLLSIAVGLQATFQSISAPVLIYRPSHFMPNTHRQRRRNETVLSCRHRRCEHEFATSSRQLLADSVDNLGTDQTESIAFD